MPEFPSKKHKLRFEHRKLRTTETEDGWSQIVRGSGSGRRGQLRAKKEEWGQIDAGTQLRNQMRSLSIHDRGDSIKGLEEKLTPTQQALYLRLWRERHKGYADVQGVVDSADEQAARGEDVAVEKLHRTFKRLSAEWKEEAGPTIEKSLMSCIPGFQRILASIDNVICLGLGSLSDGDGLYNSMWQLVFLMDFVRLCMSCQGRTTRSNIEVYAQDPVFNTVDKDFMQVLGITILKSPAAFERINATSLVYAPHLPHLSWSKAMRRGVQALMIANNIEESLQHFIDEEDLVDLFNELLASDSSSSSRFVVCPHKNEREVTEGQKSEEAMEGKKSKAVTEGKQSKEVTEDKKSKEVMDGKKGEQLMDGKKNEEAHRQAQELYVPDARIKHEFEAFVEETRNRGTTFAFPVPKCERVLSTAFYATQVYVNKRFITAPREDEQKTEGE